jgi:hypothetical protein
MKVERRIVLSKDFDGVIELLPILREGEIIAWTALYLKGHSVEAIETVEADEVDKKFIPYTAENINHLNNTL